MQTPFPLSNQLPCFQSEVTSNHQIRTLNPWKANNSEKNVEEASSFKGEPMVMLYSRIQISPDLQFH